MVPIFTEKYPTDNANYRLVSVLPGPSQVFERFLRTKSSWMCGGVDSQPVRILGGLFHGHGDAGHGCEGPRGLGQGECCSWGSL